MREILFRGKRLDNGEWVEGFLVRTTLGSTIIVNEVEEYSCGCCIGIGSANFEVDHATVGQYTGLKDKNGKRIWEGDIVKGRYSGKVAPVRHGKWDDSGRYIFGNGYLAIRCTGCGCSLREDEFEKFVWNYCPVCGADMRGG